MWRLRGIILYQFLSFISGFLAIKRVPGGILSTLSNCLLHGLGGSGTISQSSAPLGGKGGISLNLPLDGIVMALLVNLSPVGLSEHSRVSSLLKIRVRKHHLPMSIGMCI